MSNKTLGTVAVTVTVTLAAIHFGLSLSGIELNHTQRIAWMVGIVLPMALAWVVVLTAIFRDRA